MDVDLERKSAMVWKVTADAVKGRYRVYDKSVGGVVEGV